MHQRMGIQKIIFANYQKTDKLWPSFKGHQKKKNGHFQLEKKTQQGHQGQTLSVAVFLKNISVTPDISKYHIRAHTVRYH